MVMGILTARHWISKLSLYPVLSQIMDQWSKKESFIISSLSIYLYVCMFYFAYIFTALAIAKYIGNSIQ